jgi:hypothetical protein
LLNKEVILHKHLLGLLELRVKGRNLNFRLCAPLRLGLTIVKASLVAVGLLQIWLLVLLGKVDFIYIGIAILLFGSFRALSAAFSIGII